MVQKYYNMAETAQVLGKTIEDVRQMMDRRELHGYRDGADWKFKTEDIDQLAKQAPPPADDEIGDVLFAVANLARKLEIDPEQALRRTNDKFESRFHFIEQELEKAGKPTRDASLDEMEALWQKAKGRESSRGDA